MKVSRSCAAGSGLLILAVLVSCAPAPRPPIEASTTTTPTSPAAAAAPAPIVTPRGDFSAVAKLVNDDIAARRLPGAVVQVGHDGSIVFRQAYGERKLAGEPGLNGAPSPAEPMTEETIFDLASLSKPLATTPAVLQLYEQGKVALDEPVQTYLPAFNPANDPRRARVTLRMLLTHTSGIGGDLSRQGPWGLVAADRSDGLQRALTAPLEFDPGTVFHYSDIGFIILGALV